MINIVHFLQICTTFDTFCVKGLRVNIKFGIKHFIISHAYSSFPNFTIMTQVSDFTLNILFKTNYFYFDSQKKKKKKTYCFATTVSGASGAMISLWISGKPVTRW